MRASTERTRTSSRSVLIVDDEPSMRTVFARVLSRTFEPVCVESAELALDLVASGAVFDVIVCDYCLPGMLGVALFQRLQDQFPEQAARMVILSGALPSGVDEVSSATLAGRWLQKPVSPAALLRVAETVAGVRSAA
jgi:CheY-like chemotaxis protein